MTRSNPSSATGISTPSLDRQSRFLAVCFPHWIVDLERALLRRAFVHLGEPLDGALAIPFLVVEERNRVHHVLACCELAQAVGVYAGMTTSQAQAICPQQQSPEAARAGVLLERLRGQQGRYGRIVSCSDRMLAVHWDAPMAARALKRLALCLERWIPVVSIDAAACGSDDQSSGGSTLILGDFTGCAQLFRGKHATERGLMRRVAASFARRGFRTQIATASTVGGAAAMARWMARWMMRSMARGTARVPQPSILHCSSSDCCVAIPRGSELQYLESLPIEALRISAASAAALRSVEVECVGQFAKLGRQGAAARLSGRDEHAGGASTPVLAPMPAPTPAPTPRRRARSRDETPSLFDIEPHEVDARPRRSVSRSTEDVLLRLDQALGVVDETLVALRTREPVIFSRVFDGPCSRMETLFAACGELIERMAAMLQARREGLRYAVWIFRHAQLPADLSTDQMNSADLSAQARESRIDLRLARPSARRVHLWTVLRTRLESLPLDYGVESIECRVEQAVRLRFRQAQLLAGHNGVSASTANSRRAEWIDLVTSRLGSSVLGSSVRDSSVRGLSVRGLSVLGSSVLGSSCSASAIELHSTVVDGGSRQPHAYFSRGERARIVGGTVDDPVRGTVVDPVRNSIRECSAAEKSSEQVARAIATRTRWTSHGSCTVAWLDWRGTRWPLRAVDGWERMSVAWWSDNAHRESDEPASGRVYSRLQIGDGLWLFVQWPAHLGKRQVDPVHHPRSDLGLEASDWIADAAAVIEQGVELTVLGAWG
jgi:hypothetical protein